ncbi:hypothetical protein [Candidatus Phytoplasma prunorum]|uniref:hypothetical protein n=1 Tax=Candidatus Phytoplasma prunorum TaxID=47565 RepID=UPI002FEE8444
MNNLKFNFKKLIILIINFFLIFLISFNSVKAKLESNNLLNIEEIKINEKAKLEKLNEKAELEKINEKAKLEKINEKAELEKLNEKAELEKLNEKAELEKLKQDQKYRLFILKKRQEGNFFHRTLYFFKGLYDFLKEDLKSSFFGILTIIIIFLMIIFILI